MSIRRTSRTGDAEAVFSDCERYRPYLKRTWDLTLPALNCCLLNPSTATHEILDPTVQRQCVRARKLGFGSLIVTNAFDWRSTDPNELYIVDEPCSDENDGWIVHAGQESDMVICGWGAHGLLNGRGEAVLAILRAVCPRSCTT